MDAMMPMSPEEFAAKMRELAKPGDTEAAHGNADDLLCQVLVALGYVQGVEIFENMDKWYA